MTTTLEEMNRRIEIAEQFQRDARGTQGGLQITDIDEWRVIDDGQDRWICCIDGYDAAVEEIISDILEGDLRFDPEVNEYEVEWYTALCNAVASIHSNYGRSDLDAVADLATGIRNGDEKDALCRDLFDALGEDYDEWLAEWMRSAHPNGCSCGSPDCPEWIDSQEVKS